MSMLIRNKILFLTLICFHTFITQSLYAQTQTSRIQLPPIEIQIPDTHRDIKNDSVQERFDKTILGSVETSSRQTQYLGSHWSARFSSSALFDLDTQSIDVPALDLGLFDLNFFSDFYESTFGSQLHFEIAPNNHRTLNQHHLLRVGSDVSSYNFHRGDFPIEDWVMRLQFSYTYSEEQRRYYDDGQTLFTTTDDSTLDFPSKGFQRLQGSATLSRESRRHKHQATLFYVNRNENVLPAPPRGSEATLNRQLVLGNGRFAWSACTYIGRPCRLSATAFYFQNRLNDPEADIFLTSNTHELNHLLFNFKHAITFLFTEFLKFEPSLFIQGAWTHSQNQSLSLQEENITHNQIQSGIEIQSTLELFPLQLDLQTQGSLILDKADAIHAVHPQWSGQLKTSYFFASKNTLFIQAQVQKRLPSFYEKYGSFGSVQGNPKLLPEAQWGIESGVELDSGHSTIRFRGSLTAFWHSYSNLIHYIPNAQRLFTPTNISKAHTYGSSALLHIDLSSWSQTSLKLNWISAIEEIGASSHIIPGITPLRLSIRQSFNPWTWLRIAYALHWNAGLRFDHQGNLPFPDRWIHSIAINIHPKKSSFRFRLEVENLFDQLSGKERWPTIAQFPLTLPLIEQWGHPQLGRAIWLSIEFQTDTIRQSVI